VGEGHETEVSDALGSTVWDDQSEPFHSEAAPELLTAMQKAALTQETPVRSTTPALVPLVDRLGAGTCVGPVQTVPFQVSTWPVLSTTWQKVTEGHDALVRLEVIPNDWGSVHELPSHMEMPPLTETQKLVVGHEMAETLPQSLAPFDQVEPS
jgi:hypothetical protein